VINNHNKNTPLFYFTLISVSGFYAVLFWEYCLFSISVIGIPKLSLFSLIVEFLVKKFIKNLIIFLVH